MPAGALIVGASIGGLSTAEALRSAGYRDPITMIGDELHLPYSRPALSKQVLSGRWAPARTALIDEARLRALNVHVRLGTVAHRADAAGHRVVLGPLDTAEWPARWFDYDDLVIATGLVPTRPVHLTRAITVRTLDDVVRLRESLAEARRVVVVGAGVLGCELAAAIRASGGLVEVVCRRDAPGPAALRGFVGQTIRGLLEQHGVVVHTGVTVVAEAFDSSTGSTTLTLSDGREVVADLVLAAVGARPAVDWLEGSGLDLSDGVVCDSIGRAAGEVWAVGDVAAWWDPDLGRHVRREIQSSAVHQAQVVGTAIAGGPPGTPPSTYFWTELFDDRVQAAGDFPEHATLELITGTPAERRFVAAARADGARVGLVGWNMPREFRRERASLHSTGS